MTDAASGRPVVLAVAGADSSGGAGIAADIRTMAALGAVGRLAVTAVTVQTDRGVGSIHVVPPVILREQIAAALGDGRVAAVKIGMLGTAAAIDAMADALADAGRGRPVVLDPVLVSTSGAMLLDEAGIRRLLERLLPLASLLTPNLPELSTLAGRLSAGLVRSVAAQAHCLLRSGAAAVLVKGGHAEGQVAEDLLFVSRDSEPLRLAAPRVAARLRGSGCALSSAIAVHLARGHDLPAACEQAKAHLTRLFSAEADRSV